MTRGPSTPAITSGMRASSRWPSRAITSCAAFSTEPTLRYTVLGATPELAGDVAQRRLGQAVARHALDGGVEHRVERRRRRPGQLLGEQREGDDLRALVVGVCNGALLHECNDRR